MVFIFYYIAFVALIVAVLAVLPFLLQSFPVVDAERVSAYECGFEPFGDARDTFDVHFYLVGIIFIVFDIEIVFLLPWTLLFDGSLFLFELFVLLSFIFIVGFIFEARLAVLDWSKIKF